MWLDANFGPQTCSLCRLPPRMPLVGKCLSIEKGEKRIKRRGYGNMGLPVHADRTDEQGIAFSWDKTGGSWNQMRRELLR